MKTFKELRIKEYERFNEQLKMYSQIPLVDSVANVQIKLDSILNRLNILEENINAKSG